MTVKSWTLWSEDKNIMELTLGRPSFHDAGPSFMGLHAAHEDNIMPKLRKIEAYLKSLEEERRKIEAFKRELPICMQLLSSEIEASREQLCDRKDDETCTIDMSPSHKPGFTIAVSPSRKADFTTPRRMDFTFEEPNNCETLVRDGHQRLSTSSWPQAEADTTEDQEEVSAMATKLYRTRTIGSCEEHLQACSSTLGARPGGAFVPFLKDNKRSMDAEAAETTSPAHADPQDVFPSANKLGTLFSASEGATYQQFNESFAPVLVNNGICSQPSPHRKPRRNWSAELHRKFVNALKELGGSEVATPKQIRELMQVGGLTNDEVKSHLQKYRLHTKRPNPMSNIQLPAQAPTGTPQLVVLGGIWVPQDYTLKQSLGQSLYINPVSQLVDQTQMQGQPFSNQEHIHTQQHASTH